VFGWPAETVVVKTGVWATAVWVGNRVDEGVPGEIGVLSCACNEVLVGDGMDGMIDVELGTLVGGKDVGVVNKGGGVLVRGCKRYELVIAIAVLVLSALRISASLAA
jgi:hypothetical protein